MEIDRRLYAVSDPPTGRADLYPYLAAKLGPFWLVSGGWRVGDSTAAGIYGPEPVLSGLEEGRTRHRGRPLSWARAAAWLPGLTGALRHQAATPWDEVLLLLWRDPQAYLDRLEPVPQR